MENRPRTRSTLRAAAGWLAVVVALAVSWPGVQAVRADEADMTPVGVDDYAGLTSQPFGAAPPASGPEACGDASPRSADAAAQQQLLAGIPQPRPGEAGVEVEPGVVLLNNRGYNYGGTQGPSEAQWQRLEREMLAGDE